MDDRVRIINGCLQDILGRGDRRIKLFQFWNHFLCLFRWENASGKDERMNENRDMSRSFEPGPVGEGTTFSKNNLSSDLSLLENLYKFEGPS